MQQEVIIDTQKVIITRKKMKNIRLTVKSESLVCVSAPKFVLLSQIEKFVRSKLDWITLQQQKFRDAQQSFVSGANISVLGKTFTLKVCMGARNQVKFQDDLVLVFIKNVEVNPKTVFLAWAKKYLKQILPHYFQKWEQITSLKVNGFSVRDMKTRWGSCNHKNATISINVQIIFKDEDCLNYLILHEMAHIVEPSHNQNFKNFLSKYMKNWKIIRKKLKNN